ncbi:isochorismatase family protein [Saliphagus sp. GCM10025334]
MVSQRFEDAYIPERIPISDLEYFDRGGHGVRIGWGESPAVVVVDMTDEFTGERSTEGERSVEATTALLKAARAADIPVVFTRPDANLPDGYRGTTKPKAEDSPGRTGINEVDKRLNRRDDEYLLDKPRASAFFDTHLASILMGWGVDTILLTGLTTSGCVRATAVDGHSSNFNVIIVEEGVADRSQISHEISLFDMDMKYADVTPVKLAIERIRR